MEKFTEWLSRSSHEFAKQLHLALFQLVTSDVNRPWPIHVASVVGMAVRRHFIIIGAVVRLFGLQNLQRAHASTAWPTINGEIKSSGVGRSTNRKGTTYRAEIAYDYWISGTLYS